MTDPNIRIADSTRDDIQALRGFAVLLVVLFHLQTPYFQNGFVGVDVFFVISGYLVAASYERDPKTYLIKRVLRIEPALTVHGLVYLHSPAPRALDLGPAQVNGAVATCGAWVHRGSGRISYSAAALGARSLGHGAMVRVPGSWRDF